MPDHLIRAMLPAQNVRLVAALTTEVCRTAAQRHHASPAAACALGRGLSAGLLLATLAKTEERVTIQIVSNGPLRGLTVDAYGDGMVRGYPLEPQAGQGHSMQKRQRLADLIGRDGLLNIVRDIGLRDRYQGQIALFTGEVDEDVEAYLSKSEQIPSALGCEVVLNPEGEVVAAGGILLQIMPDSPAESKGKLREMQHALRTGALYDLLQTSAQAALDIATLATAGQREQIQISEERALKFQCRCDSQRIQAMVLGMDIVDIDEMIVEGRAEITCNYCGAIYTLSKEELLDLRARKPARPKQ